MPQAGFAGTQCQQDVDECASEPCGQYGTCTDGTNSFRCNCAAGWKGALCEVPTDACSSHPCQNDGHCTPGDIDDDGAATTFQCNCQDGYTGETCTEDVDECASLPCQNGAECVDGAAHFLCVCGDGGYSGKLCETHVCESASPCRHGGVCHPATGGDGGGFRCECADGWSGVRCEQPPDLCEWPVRLECGRHGSCLAHDGAAPRCTCHNGYTGEHCETEPDPCIGIDCGGNGECSKGACVCTGGWGGESCQVPPPRRPRWETDPPKSLDHFEKPAFKNFRTSHWGGGGRPKFPRRGEL